MNVYRPTLLLVLALLPAASLWAVPTQVLHDNLPQCDFLSIPFHVDEIGDPAGGFPNNEALFPQDASFWMPVCPQTDVGLPDPVVSITNLTGRDLTQVWYVADRETSITNYDGYADDAGFAPVTMDAFRIDSPISDPNGMHHPLVFESFSNDDVWQANEDWHFVLQDYTNLLNLPAWAITSVGVGSASFPLAGTIDSSGSIIAIPEPAGWLAALSAIGILPLFRRRR